MMSKSRSGIIFVILTAFLTISAWGQSSPRPGARSGPSRAEIEQIINTFTRKEAEFRQALTNYIFNRYAIIQTLGFFGDVTGEYRVDTFMTFKENGERFEKPIYGPVSTLKDLDITPEDLDDLGGINPFALDPSAVSLYNFFYIGKERLGSLECHVFDTFPKQMPDPTVSKLRVFSGRIWVEDRNLQIVKTRGKAGPETRTNKFPVVETWRENIDGKYWFPTYAFADDQLAWDTGIIVRVRMDVRYKDYKQGRSEVKILDDDVIEPAEPDAQPAATPTPAPANPPATAQKPLSSSDSNAKKPVTVKSSKSRLPAKPKRKTKTSKKKSRPK